MSTPSDTKFNISTKPFIYNWERGGRVTVRQKVPLLGTGLASSLPLFECFRQIASQPYHGGLHLPLCTPLLFLLEKIVQGRVDCLRVCVH